MKFLPLVFFALLLTSCKHSSVQDGAPAVLIESDELARQEIQQHMEDVLGGSVLLAEDVLSRSSEIVVERRAQSDPLGNRLPGRILTEPDRFRLTINQEGQCILVHENSGRHWLLQESRCVANAAAPPPTSQGPRF